MGQYYTPLASAADNGIPFHKAITGWAYSHDFKSGLKLMEHSWLGNDFVGAFAHHLLDNPKRVVWAGDYADPEPGLFVKDEDSGHDANLNLYGYVHWATDQDMSVRDAKITPDTWPEKVELTLLLNHDRRQYVDLRMLPATDATWTNGDPWRVHPLPLLTAEGNGRGGGDFGRGSGMEFVGIWARELISASTSGLIPKGFQRFSPDFTEYG